MHLKPCAVSAIPYAINGVRCTLIMSMSISSSWPILADNTAVMDIRFSLQFLVFYLNYIALVGLMLITLDDWGSMEATACRPLDLFCVVALRSVDGGRCNCMAASNNTTKCVQEQNYPLQLWDVLNSHSIDVIERGVQWFWFGRAMPNGSHIRVSRTHSWFDSCRPVLWCLLSTMDVYIYTYCPRKTLRNL